MKETLEKKCVRFAKIHDGSIRIMSTNGRQIADKWRARTDKPDIHGLIMRTTQSKAEKDPTPIKRP